MCTVNNYKPDHYKIEDDRWDGNFITLVVRRTSAARGGFYAEICGLDYVAMYPDCVDLLITTLLQARNAMDVLGATEPVAPAASREVLF